MGALRARPRDLLDGTGNGLPEPTHGEKQHNNKQKLGCGLGLEQNIKYEPED